jgi:hypothetical protein
MLEETGRFYKKIIKSSAYLIMIGNLFINNSDLNSYLCIKLQRPKSASFSSGRGAAEA